jgi:hypothetical protein
VPDLLKLLATGFSLRRGRSLHNTIYEAEPWGISREGQKQWRRGSFEQAQLVFAELRRMRVIVGGDYGFP